MSTNLLLLGKRIRHFRSQAGLTLDQLSEATGMTASQLSLIETGKREPKLTALTALASALDVSVTDLLLTEAPDRRSELEIELERITSSSVYTRLGLPSVRASKTLPTDALEAIVGLSREMERRERDAAATPEEARRANTSLQRTMLDKGNYLPEIDQIAEDMVKAAGHETGALMHRTVADIAASLGFTLIYVDDLPHSARSVTDLENRRIYLPPASIPGGHGLRAMALQAVAHRVLGHEKPLDYADFLKQRLEINYFAALWAGAL